MTRRSSKPEPLIVATVIAEKGSTWGEETRKVARTDAERILEALVAEYGVDAAMRALDNQGFKGAAYGYLLKPLQAEALRRRQLHHSLYKLETTPSGKKLWTYMAAILEATGMDQGEVFPLDQFLGNFQTHLDSQRIMRAEGGYRLTPKGMAYFNDRYNLGSAQHIEAAEVEIMKRGVTTGIGTDKWTRIK
jgi:hypothetical protein